MMLLSEWEGSKTGFQNSYHQTERKKEDDKKPSRPLPQKDPGFYMFAKWLSIPEYAGLFNWQQEHHQLTWDAKYEMTLAPREHGKSIKYNTAYQWAMQYKDFDILLLGWTDRRKEIALYVYNFFYTYDLIENDKRTSPYHFRIKNGGKFDCYLITSKETLGMHSEGAQERFIDLTDEDWLEFKSLFEIDIDDDYERVFDENELKAYVESRKGSERKLWISIDDPIDITFMKERHKETTLEMHFNSSLYGIHPDKWSFTGTRKFEGDFFDFIDAKFGKELVKYIRGTRNPDGSLLCPEMFTHPELPTFKKDIEKGKKNLAQIREHVGEYAWHSEYEQNPHPISGEVWDTIEQELMLDGAVNRNYDLCFISIDRATTMRDTSDFTGCIIGLRHNQTGNRIIIEDFTDHMSFDELLLLLNDYIIEFHNKYESIKIILIVEKQGGGDDLITMAKNTRVFIKKNGEVVQNKICDIAVIVDLHNTGPMGSKQQRIQERLTAPIKNGKCRVLRRLMKSEVVNEILTFPHCAKFDGIDALANAEFILLRDYPFVQGGIMGNIEKMTALLRENRRKKELEKYKHLRLK